MVWFPMSISLEGQRVFLIGDGPQIRDKKEKLRPFGPEFVERPAFTEADALSAPAMVLVGDLPEEQAAAVSALCKACRIPVNVVDRPALCSFYFPALIIRGSLSVGISTAGQCPAAAGYLRQRTEADLPDRTEEILDWLALHRQLLRQRRATAAVTEAAFSLGRPLTAEELANFW